MKFINFVFIFTMINMTAFSQNYMKFGIDTDNVVPEGLKVGTKAPEFNGVNQLGKAISLSESLKEGKVVLIFYRGYWCPFCSRYLSKYQDSLQLIIDKGAGIIAITPEGEEGVGKTAENVNAGFDIISDVNNEIQKKYDVLFKVNKKYNMKIRTMLFTDIARNNGEDEAHLPVPATFIIGGEGNIEYVQFDPDYKKRASVAEILKNL